MIPWPELHKARALELFEQPITMRECMDIINREFQAAYTISALKGLRQRLGACRRHRDFEWTDERVAIMLAAKDEGVSQFVAAERIGCTVSIVHHKCRNLGIKWDSGGKKTPPFWTEERKAELRRLRISEGMTTLQISEVMKAPRGGVIAQLGRLGIKAGDNAPKKRKVVASRLSMSIGYVSANLEPRDEGRSRLRADLAAPDSKRVRIHKLFHGMCSWPLGDPRTPEFRYCGAPSGQDGHYCAFHHALGHQPLKKAPGHIRSVVKDVEREPA